jgi:hypothetical protein
MKINRFLNFYQGHLSRKIVTSGLGSISNFSILFFSAGFFISAADASEFLALFSFAVILSNYFAYVLLFRNGQPDKLIIDISFLLMIATMILAISIYRPDKWLLSILIVLLMFAKELFRIMGVEYCNNDKFITKLCVSIIPFLMVLLLITHYYTINFIDVLALGFIFMLQLIPIFLFKFHKDSILLSMKPSKVMNLYFNAAAEIMPIMAGYFVNVYSLNLMKASEYVEYRMALAVVGLSSLIGTISLIVLLSDREKSKKHLSKLAAMMIASILISIYFIDSMNVITAVTLLIFSISAIINSYNKIYLSRPQNFCLQFIPAFLIIVFVLNSKQIILIQFLLVLSSIQILYFILSFWMIKSKEFVF